MHKVNVQYSIWCLFATKHKSAAFEDRLVAPAAGCRYQREAALADKSGVVHSVCVAGLNAWLLRGGASLVTYSRGVTLVYGQTLFLLPSAH